MHIQCYIWIALLVWVLTTSTLLMMNKDISYWVDVARVGSMALSWCVMWISGMVVFFNIHNNCGTIESTHGMHNLVEFCLLWDFFCLCFWVIVLPMIAFVGCCTGENYIFAMFWWVVKFLFIPDMDEIKE
jgi:hypothetical protein